MTQNRYLLLQNGQVFQGQGFGAQRDAVGEVVFSTGMTGYLETVTDPSYYGQIVVQTFPLIGNTGVNAEDFEGEKPMLSAYIVRDLCETPSNFRSKETLHNYLFKNNIVGISGIDTRALTRVIREEGVINGAILSSLEDREAVLEKLNAFEIDHAVLQVTCKEQKRLCSVDNPQYRVVLWDFGAKESIARELLRRGCEVERVPANTTSEEIIALSPQGVVLSNGPGDPAKNKRIIEEIRKLCAEKIPMFGICLGHQLMALAQGAGSRKMKYGHRGANQPVRDTKTGRLYITSQNHGYAMLTETLPVSAHVLYENANDGTCEGIEYQDMPVFTVQFHPEACGGPHDTMFLFERFLAMMK